MISHTLVGSKGADYVNLSTLKPAGVDTLTRAGVKFVCRYVARSSSIGKIITAKERDILHDAGILISLVYEGNLGDHLGGAPAGRANGQFARQFARDLGHPDAVPLWCAVDRNVLPGADALKASDYVRAFADGAEQDRPAGYMDTDAARVLAPWNPYWWRPAAKSWGALEPGDPVLHMQQHLVTADNFDPNTCLAPVPMWAAADAPWTPPEPRPLVTLPRPTRLLDTRKPGPLAGWLAPGAQIGLPILANEVVVNVTATGADGPGWLTVWGPGEDAPATSNVNYAGPAAVANSVRTYTDGGLLRIKAFGSGCHVVVDLQAAR